MTVVVVHDVIIDNGGRQGQGQGQLALEVYGVAVNYNLCRHP